jgi:hypothetical protein
MALEAGQHEISAKWLETALGQLHENQDEALSLTEFDFHIRHCLGQPGNQRMNKTKYADIPQHVPTFT